MSRARLATTRCGGCSIHKAPHVGISPHGRVDGRRAQCGFPTVESVRWFDSEKDTATIAEAVKGSVLVPVDGGAERGTSELTGVRGTSAAAPVLPAELGPLARFIVPGVTDVLVNGGEELWTDSGLGLERRREWLPISEDAMRELAVQVIAAGGRHLDTATPAVDVRLPGGIRAHAALPPVSVGRTVLSVRVPAGRQWSLESLVEVGAISASAAEILRGHVAQRSNLLVTGAAGVGKTTLLAALMAAVPHDERIITVEDVAELQIEHPHVVSLEVRQANIEGAGAFGLDRLVREALRMRPDRLVVGECRGSEIRELLMALGTGHDGGAGTLHARSLADVPTRLEALGALAGLTTAALARLAASSIDVVVHLERSGSHRGVAAMGALELSDDGRLIVEPITE